VWCQRPSCVTTQGSYLHRTLLPLHTGIGTELWVHALRIKAILYHHSLRYSIGHRSTIGHHGAVELLLTFKSRSLRWRTTVVTFGWSARATIHVGIAALSLHLLLLLRLHLPLLLHHGNLLRSPMRVSYVILNPATTHMLLAISALRIAAPLTMPLRMPACIAN
jgi:hypothetical protein